MSDPVREETGATAALTPAGPCCPEAPAIVDALVPSVRSDLGMMPAVLTAALHPDERAAARPRSAPLAAVPFPPEIRPLVLRI